MPRRKPERRRIGSVDLFCGAGGLTKGLVAAGIDVSLGVDIDPACEFPFTYNNDAQFLLKSVADLVAGDLSAAFEGADYTLIAGCAPCQPFSTYSQGWSGPDDSRRNLLDYFFRLVVEAQPDLVIMENVPRLQSQGIFSRFVDGLEREGFDVFHDVINCADYGVPQQRQRLILIASKLGPISLIEPTYTAENYVTVRDAIGGMPKLKAGEVCETDPLHQACTLSSLNLKRIRASKPGGTWRDWPENLIAECHKRNSGRTYPSVYGRMSWDKTAPTMTTQYYGFGNGRFGHPDQDRAISLREGAILQSFPADYRFTPPEQPIYCKHIGRLIGNAVPVELAKAIGTSIVQHVEGDNCGTNQC